MEHQRPHLDRAHGDMERGIADVAGEHIIRHAAPHAPPPAWLTSWESRRAIWIQECFGEFIGVFFYVFLGLGASAAFFISSAEKENGFGSLFSIGVCYGAGIVLALLVSASSSGGHLSPSYTIAFAVFRGFPARKVPYYILSQTLGAFVAALCVYGIYEQELSAIHDALLPLGPKAIFSAQGPAGILALFPGATQSLGNVFLNEFLCNFILTILVFACLDPTNPFVHLAVVPVLIGGAYAAIIISFAMNSLALNTARDLGGRMACSVIYGSGCWTTYGGYTALAALVNIPATLLGGFAYTILLGHTGRQTLIRLPANPEQLAEMDRIESRRPREVRELKSDNSEKALDV